METSLRYPPPTRATCPTQRIILNLITVKISIGQYKLTKPPQHVALSSPALCHSSFTQASFPHVLKYPHATLFLLLTPVYQQKAKSEELPRSTCAISTNVLLVGSIKLYPSPPSTDNPFIAHLQTSTTNRKSAV
jgi:hypothetical protein